MKKFLIFLSAIIVVISISMTFYYFAKDEEVIKINTSTVYLNIGDSISLDELGFSHTEKKKETTINFNAGGEDVQSIIYFDSSTNRYVTTNLGGKTTIVIKTNNKKFKRFEINVVVGNGTEETPFHIATEEDLFNIGTSTFDVTPGDDTNDALSASYVLMNNITITDAHPTIGVTETGYDVFNGHFNGNYFTIEGLNVTEGTYGGLFANLGKTSFVENLYIKNATVVGNFDYAGIIAGVNSGYIDRISITNSVVNNTNTSTTSYTGGVAGKIMTINPSDFETTPATVYRVNISSEDSSINYIKGYGYLGGIAGEINCANIEGIKLDTAIKSAGKNIHVGGFAGVVVLENGFGFVRESLSLSQLDAKTTNSNAGALFGLIDADGSSIDIKSVFLGLYYSDKTTLDVYGQTSLPTLKDEGFTTVASKTDTQLKNINTYLFYINTNDQKIAWNSSVWSLVEGQYPNLKFTTLDISGGNIDVDVPTTNPDNNDNNTTDTPDDPIVNPDLPSDVKEDVVKISTANELLNVKYENGYTYYLCNDINLKGATITPKALNNAVFTSLGDEAYTISNFNITPETNYCGFFSSVNNSKINNVNFNKVSVNVLESVDYIGVLVGRANNAKISNITLSTCDIISTLTNQVSYSNIPEYVGGLVGATTTASNQFDNIIINNIEISGHLLNVGGIAGLVNKNTEILNSSIIGNIRGREYVGGITSKNQGKISNSKVECNIYSSTQSTNDAYIGGIAGANFSKIENCTDNTINITVSNNSTANKYYIGGITGFNTKTATINNCEIFGDGINTDDNIGIMIIGGVAGQNNGQITACYNKMDTVGSTYKNTIVGGIVGRNFGNSSSTLYGRVTKSYTTSDLNGEFVGGILCSNADNAQIEECAITANPKLKGLFVAGIVAYLNSGLIKNCLAIAETCGISSSEDTAVTAGLALSIGYESSTVYGHIDHCITSIKTSSNSNGEHYLITLSNINSKKAITGKVTNSVIDKSKSPNASLPDGDITKRVEEMRSSYKIVSTGSQMSHIAIYDAFEISQEPDQIWYLEIGSDIPVLTSLRNK